MSKEDKKTKVNSEIEELKAQIEDLTEALRRERADNINMRSRHEKDVASLRSLVKANVVRDFLPVIDDFERSINHIPKNIEDTEFVKGVKGIIKKFAKTLEDLGVERIPTVGEEFNPTFHEAVSMEDGEGTTEVITDELQPGYKLGDNVIRHAMVKVKMIDKA